MPIHNVFANVSAQLTSSIFPVKPTRATIVVEADSWNGATLTLYTIDQTGAQNAVSGGAFTANAIKSCFLPSDRLVAIITAANPVNLTLLVNDTPVFVQTADVGSGGGGGGGDVNIAQVGGVAVGTTVPVSATALPLPVGASTAALQTTGNTTTAAAATSVASIDAKTPALGQGVMAASSPVVIASNQTAVPVSAAALPLPTGASTEATLAAASAKLPAALGQTTMAASMAVTMASNQSALPVTVGAAAASIGKAEDAASADADVGVPAMAIQNTTPADTAGTDGDYAMLQMKNGRLWTSTTVPAAATSIGKAEDVASADADVGVPAMMIRQATPANTSGTDGDYEMLRGNAGKLWVDIGVVATIDASVTRPADTNAYAVNDAMSDSTSAPTAGGFTFSNAARFSAGGGIITDAVITSSADPATTLQGEIWLFDQAVTAINDNAVFAMSDSDVLNLVGVIPFTLASTVAGSGTNSFAHVSGLNYGFDPVGTANLRYLIKVKNAYTPISGEVLKVRLKILQI